MNEESKNLIKLGIAVTGTIVVLYGAKMWAKSVADKRWESKKNAMFKTRPTK